jgi:hypothetical protein
MNPSLAINFRDFSVAFDAARRVWDSREGLYIDYQSLDSKPFDAISFFTMYAHERPFSNPRYAIAHRMAILRNIGAIDAREPGVNDKFANKYCEPGFPEAVWKDFKELLRIADRDKETRKRMAKYTKGPVRTILETLKENRKPSIVALLRSMTLRQAYELLKKIDGIGHKIAALFLRDVHSYSGGWHNAEESEYCLQPVDRWVGKLAAMCWRDIDPRSNPEKMAKDIVIRCRKQGIDPIAFNKGAWFVGAHFQKLCSFSNIETTERLSDTGTLSPEAILRFDPHKVKKAIETLNKAERAGKIYPL